MFRENRSILTAPNHGNSPLIRILKPRDTVVNGSVLIVPHGCVGEVFLNGSYAESLPPGRHTIDSGESPYLRSFRNRMYGGSSPTDVTVYVVDTHKLMHSSFGTGPIQFMQQRFQYTLNALACVNLHYQISDSRLFVEHLVGSFAAEMQQDSVDAFLSKMLLAPVRYSLGNALSSQPPSALLGQLTSLCANIQPQVKQRLAALGIRLIAPVDLVRLELTEDSLNKVHELEKKEAEGSIDLSLTRQRNQAELEYQQQRLRTLFGNDSTRYTLYDTSIRGGGQGGHSPMADYMNFILMSQMMGDMSNLFHGGAPLHADVQTPAHQGGGDSCPLCGGPIVENCCTVCGNQAGKQPLKPRVSLAPNKKP